MRFEILTIVLFLLSACSPQVIEEANTPTTVSNFNLHKDLHAFSNKMEEGDTLYVFADLSICLNWHQEKNLISKRNGKLYIESSNEGDFLDSTETALPPVLYGACPTDTLSLEYLFETLGKERLVHEESRSRFTVAYQTDTIRYTSTGLGDAMQTVRFYNKIKACLYPQARIYKPHGEVNAVMNTGE